LLGVHTKKKNSAVVESFKKDFLKVKKRGFVESKRSHDTGIGKTFEDLLNIVENNNSLADYQGILEIKSKRELSESMLTLFTKAPSNPPKANAYLREKYGHKEKGMKILHTTISGARYNTFFNKLGFKLEVDESRRKIFVLVKDLASDKILDNHIYYNFEDIKQIIHDKCDNIVYINAETRKKGNVEEFFFKDATLLTGLSFKKFIEAVKQGLIVYDIRIGVYRSGKNKGKTHDHGSGFRILTKNINKVFEVEEI
jgi:hypothetical protein